jgi:hypothetical protein
MTVLIRSLWVQMSYQPYIEVATPELDVISLSTCRSRDEFYKE